MGKGGEIRSKVLDGLRGLAVLQVAAYHYFLMGPMSSDWVKVFQRLGNVLDGVTLFFVLSGFLIGGNLLDARKAPALFRAFYGRRACRILPLYAVLLISFVFVRLVDARMKWGFIYYWHSEIPFWHYLVFWQNNTFSSLRYLGAPWLVVTWSLAVEQQFYLVIPPVIRFVTQRWLLLVVCVSCMLAAVWHRLAFPDFTYLLVDRLDAFAAGLLMAICVRSEAGRELKAGNRRALRLLLITYGVILFGMRAGGGSCTVIDNPLVASLMYALWIWLLVDDTPWWPVRPVLGLLAPIGQWSYFIYLFHLPVVYLFTVFFPVATPAALLLTIALAAFSYRYFEEPLIRWGHRLQYGTPDASQERS